jgi:hypothetical protein
VRFVRSKPFATAEHVPQIRPDSPSGATAKRKALVVARRSCSSTADLAALDEVLPVRALNPAYQASEQGGHPIVLSRSPVASVAPWRLMLSSVIDNLAIHARSRIWEEESCDTAELG